MNIKHKVLLGAVALATVSTPVVAQSDKLSSFSEGDAISLTGKVESAADSEFVINYGTGAVTVDMGGWDWYSKEAERLTPGETVTVMGVIDDGFFKGREIKAENIYIHDRYSYYYTNYQDNSYYTWSGIPPEGSWVNVSGTVKDIKGREFTLHNGRNEIRVDTSHMQYNPLDDEGYQKIKEGDRVRVSGNFRDDFFDTREVEATMVVNLFKRPGA